MILRERVAAVVDELKRLKREGENPAGEKAGDGLHRSPLLSTD